MELRDAKGVGTECAKSRVVHIPALPSPPLPIFHQRHSKKLLSNVPGQVLAASGGGLGRHQNPKPTFPSFPCLRRPFGVSIEIRKAKVASQGQLSEFFGFRAQGCRAEGPSQLECVFAVVLYYDNCTKELSGIVLALSWGARTNSNFFVGFSASQSSCNYGQVSFGCEITLCTLLPTPRILLLTARGANLVRASTIRTGCSLRVSPAVVRCMLFVIYIGFYVLEA